MTTIVTPVTKCNGHTQIDPGLLQQTIQQSSLISQAMPCDSTSGNTPVALQDGPLSTEDTQGSVGVVLPAVGLQAGDGAGGASSLSNVVLQAADGHGMVFRSVAGLTTTTATTTAVANGTGECQCVDCNSCHKQA